MGEWMCSYMHEGKWLSHFPEWEIPLPTVWEVGCIPESFWTLWRPSLLLLEIEPRWSTPMHCSLTRMTDILHKCCTPIRLCLHSYSYIRDGFLKPRWQINVFEDGPSTFRNWTRGAFCSFEIASFWWEIWGFHGPEDSGRNLLDCDTV